MKIQCDVCSKDEAAFFCVADEAALCHACDHKVHHANKLASKHQRFTLHHPSSEQAPLCDICKERRAFLFCQQDRAILCRECDGPIHNANEHTQKHDRFVLTGVKISATSAVYSSSPDSMSESVPSLRSQDSSSNKVVVASPTVPAPISKPTNSFSSSNLVSPMGVAEVNEKNGGFMNGGADCLTSSLSEYLEMLPGYHVEELLDSSYPDGLCKMGGNDVLPFWDTDLESNLSCMSSERAGIWVPQASPHHHQFQHNQTQTLPSATIAFGAQIGFKEPKASRKWADDNSFAVPQIRPSSTTFKRSRNFW
ncbi:B-box zinc finger protein 21-like [Ipomoea triloba]|uniref:B-box zinc finger protein 21-like n=1 Tax=Ipomoea triloba TaxID=35885 RepID=UPI00125DD9DD|nr:B-box zinc finger protein 21-like [Ipomoea triloba]